MQAARLPSIALASALALALAACTQADPAPRADPASYRVETVAEGLADPWAVAVLPDGRRLVTLRAGGLIALAPDGGRREIALDGFPPIYADGQNGLMDVVPDPDFASTGALFFTAAYGSQAATNASLIRARLEGDRLADVRVLFRATAKRDRSNNGSRLAFLPDGTLVMTLGDGFDRREDAQDPANHLGKIVRLDREGRAPADNPLAGRPGAAPEIYSLGHRNVQGAARDLDGTVLVSEHGPRGGDEINVLKPGANYGWPVVTGGLDYTFARVSPWRRLEGFEDPLVEWTPSIAPAGLAVYDGALFAGWRGDLLVPGLKEKAVRRVKREGGRVVGQELLLAELGERMRDVEAAPDGSIYVLTDGKAGRLLRLTPAAR